MKFQFRKQNKHSSDHDGGANKQRASFYQDFAQKVGAFFHPEPQKEKVLRHEDFQAAGDLYYASVSAGYTVAQRVLCVILVVFLCISVMTYYREITYDNFFYLFKDFSSAVDAGSTDYEQLSYDSDTRHRFALYRGGLAIVNPSSVSVFSATGRRTLRQTSDFSSPFAIASDQYVLVYDTSGTTFSLYNSFAKVHSEHFDYPVTDACFAGDRTFAVVSRTDRSKSVVYAYDRNFKFKGSVPYSYYIFDIALDSDNGRMMSAGYDNGSGTGKTMVEIREYPFVKEENATLSHTIEIEGEFPLGCGFLDEKRIAVVTTAGIYIYDQNAELLTSERYVGKTVLGFDISSHGVSVVTVYASQNEAIAFDAAGRMVYHDSILLNADEVGQFDGYLFLKAQNQVLRIELSTGQEKRLQSSDGQMLVYDQKTVLVCGEAKAAYLIF